jgi:hypothetical protein
MKDISALGRVRLTHLFCESPSESWTHTDESRGDDGEGAPHLLAVVAQGGGDGLGLGGVRETGETQQKDAVGGAPEAEDELAEVLVGSEQEAFLAGGQIEHGVVADPGGEFGDVEEVVALGAQAGDDTGLDALVGEEPHAADVVSG